MSDWTAWQALERPYSDDEARPDDVDGESGHLDERLVSRLLLIELQRPPWYREIDAEKRALAREAA